MKCCRRRRVIRSGPVARSEGASMKLAHPGKRYGVGFACVQKDFGTGAETSFAKVEIAADGKISAASYGGRDRHGHVDLAGDRVSRSGSASRPPTCACRDDRLARSAGRHERRSVHDVAGASRTSCRRIRAGRRVMRRRRARRIPRSISRIARAKRRASSSRTACGRRRWRYGARAIGGGQAAPLVVRIEDARWVDGKLSAAGLEAAAARTAREEGARTRARHRRGRARVQSLAMERSGIRDRRRDRASAASTASSLRYGDKASADQDRRCRPVEPVYRVLDRKRVFIPPVSATTPRSPTTARSARWSNSR